MPKTLHAIHTETEPITVNRTLARATPGVPIDTEVRERPVRVYALVSDLCTTAAVPCDCHRRAAGKHHSIAFWSPTDNCFDAGSDDERVHEHHRPGTESGHVIAKVFGGPRCCKNLVPMRSRVNKSTWKINFENKLSSASGLCFVKVECSYEDGLDKRIPTQIKGEYKTLDIRDVMKDAQRNTPLSVTAVARAVAEAFRADPSLVRAAYERSYDFAVLADYVRAIAKKSMVAGAHVKTPEEFLPVQIRGGSLIVHQIGAVRQLPASPEEPLSEVDAEALHELLDTYHAAQKNYRVETSGHLGYEDASRVRLRGRRRIEDFHVACLPPWDRRPYAVLDYLALNGRLDRVVKNSNGNWVDIDAQYLINHRTDEDFPAEMKALVAVANRWMTEKRESAAWGDAPRVSFSALQGNAYLSDARHHGDRGDLGEGWVVTYQVDHIVPVNPTAMAGFERGPTLFSNAQITSQAYNGSKNNRLLGLLPSQLVFLVRTDRVEDFRNDSDSGSDSGEDF